MSLTNGRWTFGQATAILVVSTAAPLLLLAALSYSWVISSVRETARLNLMGNARSLAAIVDNEVDTYKAIAKTLAAASSLQRGDFETFMRHANRALAGEQNIWLYVVDRNRRIVASTTGAEAGDRELNLSAVSDAFEQKRVTVSDLMIGQSHSQPAAYVVFPAVNGPTADYALALAVSPQRLHALLGEKFAGNPAIGILDSQKRFLARTPYQEKRLGTLAAESWRNVIAKQSEGVFETVTLEGVPSMTAYVTTRDGWIAGLSFPTAYVNEPSRRVLRTAMPLGLLTIALSLCIGLFVGRQLSNTLRGLALLARKVGAGEIVSAKPKPFTEIDEIGKALTTTSQQLAARTYALKASEGQFRGTFENAAVGVAHVDLGGRFRLVNDKLCEILGYSREELEGRTVKDVSYAEDMLTEESLLEKLRAGHFKSYSLDKRFSRKNEGTIWTGVTVSLQLTHDGNQDYFIKIVRDITAQKAAQEHERFLMRELAHRLKNQLSVIQSMARQTARSVMDLNEFQHVFTERLVGLAGATDVLVKRGWKGADLRQLIGRQTDLFVPESKRLVLEGPNVVISPDATEAIGLAMHELATNSVKHGAWSSTSGSVTISWEIVDGDEGMTLRWQETGGPSVAQPRRKGFGHMVIETMVALKVGGTAELSFDAGGVRWTLHIPRSHILWIEPR